MWEWITARYARATHQRPMTGPAPVLPPERHPARISGQYGQLYTYLDGRYADMVVLTFAQVEDILGFPLPDSSRTRPEWWTTTDAGGDHPGAGEAAYSDAWRLAGRTALPNMAARTVAFERRVV
jgi:hypothetical protein